MKCKIELILHLFSRGFHNDSTKISFSILNIHKIITFSNVHTWNVELHS